MDENLYVWMMHARTQKKENQAEKDVIMHGE
jgi:hypothetical protein